MAGSSKAKNGMIEEKWQRNDKEKWQKKAAQPMATSQQGEQGGVGA